MKVFKDKSGRWIEGKEFRKRFAQGVEGISPLQQIKSQIFFSWITIIGLLCGLTVSIYRWNTLWWLGIILIAGTGNTIVGLIGLYQKRNALINVENMLNNVEGGQSNEK